MCPFLYLTAFQISFASVRLWIHVEDTHLIAIYWCPLWCCSINCCTCFCDLEGNFLTRNFYPNTVKVKRVLRFKYNTWHTELLLLRRNLKKLSINQSTQVTDLWVSKKVVSQHFQLTFLYLALGIYIAELIQYLSSCESQNVLISQ